MILIFAAIPLERGAGGLPNGEDSSVAAEMQMKNPGAPSSLEEATAHAGLPTALLSRWLSYVFPVGFVPVVSI